MATPDVRVRLSADGVQEVVNALRRVQDEANKAGKGGAAGFGLMNAALNDLKGLLPAIGVGAVVAGFGMLAKNAIDAADGLDELSQKTGASVETLSALLALPDAAALGVEGLTKSLTKFSDSLDKLRNGEKTASEAFDRIGISVKDLQGLDPAQAFIKVSERMGSMRDGADKTAVALDLFGKQGAELIPLMNDLADKGFEAVRAKAEELGILMDGDFAAAAAGLKDQLQEMKTRAQGLTTQFLVGLIPAVNSGMDAMSNGAGRGGESVSILGQVVGTALNGIILIFLTTGRVIGAWTAAVVDNFSTVGQVLDAITSGDFKRAGAAIKDGFNRQLSVGKMLVQDIKADAARLFANVGDAAANAATGSGGRTGTVKAKVDKDALLKAAQERVKLLQQQKEIEVKLLQAGLKLQEQAEKEAYDQGLIGLRDYYTSRRRIALEGLDAELSLLQQKRDIAASAPAKDAAEEIKRQQEVQKIEGEISLKRIERQQTEAGLLAEERNAYRALYQERVGFEQTLLDAQGRRIESARLALSLELQQAAAILRRQGLSESEVSAQVERLRQVRENGIAFDEIQQQATQALRDLQRAKQEIQNQVEEGRLFEFQAEQQILALEQQRLPVLKEIADQMNRAAVATGDQQKVEQAKDFSGDVRLVEVEVTKATNSLGNFVRAAEQAGMGALTDFLSTGVTQARSFSDAFRSMAASVVQSLQKMAAQALATKIFKSLGGSFGFAEGGLVKAATGGYITGPGTATSDSIPARLSNGEFVVRAAVVSQPGVLEWLHFLNSGGSRSVRRASSNSGRYAEGGLVTPAAAAGGQGQALRIVNVMDPAIAGDYLNSSAGEKVLLNVVQRNAGALRQILGN